MIELWEDTFYNFGKAGFFLVFDFDRILPLMPLICGLFVEREGDSLGSLRRGSAPDPHTAGDIKLVIVLRLEVYFLTLL